MAKIEQTALAKSDLADIWLYIAADQGRLGDEKWQTAYVKHDSLFGTRVSFRVADISAS